MNDVEIAITLLAMIGGLLLANVANNMADALRARRDLPIGFVPWAINFYISAAIINTLGLMSTFDETWSSGVVFMVGLLAALMPYIMVSRLLYPEHKERWTSVEDYYIANRKMVLGLMVIAPVVSIINLAPTDLPISGLEKTIFLLVSYGPIIVTLILLMLTDKRKWHWAGWGFLLVHRIVMMSLLAITVNVQA